MKTTETTGTGERQPTHDFQIFQKRLLPIPSREKMPNNRHAYQDYNGPRTKGFTPPQLDQEEEENPLDALWVEEEGGLSLAPPCGSPVSFIHAMLDFVCLSKEDILYDVSDQWIFVSREGNFSLRTDDSGCFMFSKSSFSVSISWDVEMVESYWRRLYGPNVNNAWVSKSNPTW